MLKGTLDIPDHELNVDLSGQITWMRYFVQYRTAVDAMITSLENKEVHRVDVVFPLLNMMRHSMEIGLKMNVLLFETLDGIQKKYDSLENNEKHNLGKLYTILESHIIWTLENHDVNANLEKEAHRYIRITNKHKHQLVDLDSSNQEARYPFSNNGKKSFQGKNEIHLKELILAYFEIGKFLMFMEDVFREEAGLFVNWEDYL